MQNKKATLVLILLFVALSLFSQEKLRRQAVYLELLGSGVIGSVNYDFRFKPGNDGMGMRMGFGYVPDVLVFPGSFSLRGFNFRRLHLRLLLLNPFRIPDGYHCRWLEQTGN